MRPFDCARTPSQEAKLYASRSLAAATHSSLCSAVVGSRTTLTSSAVISPLWGTPQQSLLRRLRRSMMKRRLRCLRFRIHALRIVLHGFGSKLFAMGVSRCGCISMRMCARVYSYIFVLVCMCARVCVCTFVCLSTIKCQHNQSTIPIHTIHFPAKSTTAGKPGKSSSTLSALAISSL
jgi:hypothetical protein